jgi:hypothetical protein
MRRIAVGVLAAVALAGVGCISTRSGPLRPASVPVPPSDEIEVLDPGVGTTHVPPVLTGVGDDGLQRIDVPPAVLVHRYYPSGDRNFQAQFLPGGPVVVAVNHPKTMERVYVPVTLPPGAPRVTYSGKAIRYDYGPQSVTLSFGPLGQPTVKYSQGTAIGERVRNLAENVGEGTAELAETAGVPQGWQRVKAGVGKVFTNTAEAVGRLRRPLPAVDE